MLFSQLLQLGWVPKREQFEIIGADIYRPQALHVTRLRYQGMFVVYIADKFLCNYNLQSIY